MDAAIVGLLTACASVSGIGLWMLWVRPDQVLDLWVDRPLTGEDWGEDEAAILPVARGLFGILLVVSSFAVGFAMAFLTRTG